MSAAQFLQAVKSLLPPGAAWRAESGGPLDGVLAAWADEAALVDDRVEALLAESDPRSATELLQQWEALAGLPDAGNPTTAGLGIRRGMVHGRFTDNGDVSEPGWIARAARLGGAITLSEFTPSRAGVMQAGDELAPQDAVFVLGITAALSTAGAFRAGDSQTGDMLGEGGATQFEFNMKRMQQGHTQLFFNYV